MDKSTLKDILEPALIHIYGREEHADLIEISIQTMKERSMSRYSGLPYKHITILMVQSVIEAITEVLNAFLSKNRISSTLSHATIVQGKPKFYFSKAVFPFGSYALVYEGTTNTMQPTSVLAIALKRSNNAGRHYFMSLYSSKRIHRYKWEVLPIDEHIIARVEQLAEDEEQPIMNQGMSCFEWTPGTEIRDKPNIEDERRLIITNGYPEIEEQDQLLVDMQPQLEQL